jgi:Flp pilus assembly pilin Flp
VGCLMDSFLRRVWHENEGQDIAEYAVMLAVILVLVVGTIRLVGTNANNAFPLCPVRSSDMARRGNPNWGKPVLPASVSGNAVRSTGSKARTDSE